MVKTLILPGLFGSGEGHWQRYWLDDHPEAVLVEQGDWNRPALAAWRSALEAEIERHPSVDIVAHSLGCLLVASMARRPIAERIRSVLLVAPCDLEETERLHPGAIDFGIIPRLRLGFPSLVVGSLNDPYMRFDRLQALCGRWNSRLIDLGHAGHINIASGFGRWPAGYDLLKVLNGMVKDDHPVVTPAMPVRQPTLAGRQRTSP
ncbi:putative esterase of the alpha/beta hydrolase fold (plasmid) [Sinorhizobium fredii NGR234]|uniref:Esterase of the alpha/beta hydrolase fold n=1 Tax=Sinorhizobium fredii (strain NBRC 101917 / NGR234) TaxID=394 RepID=C3KS07_SINFN|nr:alpha/beta hydrolase [Sinorhizobium fredii]ACP22865.1 putative esterase of the alpha/beta hydrolase fold [Sinorhizobium fredii NGR234]